MRVDIDDSQLRRALRILKQLPRKAQKELEDTVDDLGLHLQRRAQKRTPIKEGHLKRSADAHLKSSGGDLTVAITFGGMAEAYAEVQHEREDFNHPKGGRAHFLFGDDGSAWNAAEQRTHKYILRKKLQELGDKWIRKAGGGG